MTDPSYRNTALRYCVDDLPGASLPGARLQGIIESLRLGRPVTHMSLAFLQKEGLDAMHQLESGQLSYDRFREVALAEQVARVEVATAAKLAAKVEERAHKAAMQEKENCAMEQAEAARLARERDPKYIAKIKQRELRARYGIAMYVEQDCLSRLMEILKRVDAGQRLSEEDFVWLSSAGEDYFTDELRAAYHRLEADFFAGEFKKTRDPGPRLTPAAITANAIVRAMPNCYWEPSRRAAKVAQAQISPLHDARRGHADLRRWNAALRLGEQAHAFKPDDYRPCTLLGAVHMEMGDYGLGQEWYAKAVKRSASEDSVDQDLRNIFFRADQAKQVQMRGFLLGQDRVRYTWAKPTTMKGDGKPGGPKRPSRR